MTDEDQKHFGLEIGLYDRGLVPDDFRNDPHEVPGVTSLAITMHIPGQGRDIDPQPAEYWELMLTQSFEAVIQYLDDEDLIEGVDDAEPEEIEITATEDAEAFDDGSD